METCQQMSTDMNDMPALPIHDFADSKLFITPAAHRVIRKSGTGQAIDGIYTLYVPLLLFSGRICFLGLCNRRISQMMFQPKMMDFETLTPCAYLNSSQMCTYFCKDLVTEYCPYLVKIRFPTLIRFQIDFIIPMLLL